MDDMLGIDECRRNVKTLEDALGVARGDLDHALAAHTEIEELARQLWVEWVAEFEDDSGVLIEEWRRDVDQRNHDWFSLNIDDDRERFRGLAANFLLLAQHLLANPS